MHQPQDTVHRHPHPEADGPGAARDDSAKTTPVPDMQPEDACSDNTPGAEVPVPCTGTTPPREGPGREREPR